MGIWQVRLSRCAAGAASALLQMLQKKARKLLKTKAGEPIRARYSRYGVTNSPPASTGAFGPRGS
jgi:hypothetical protein